MASVLGKGFKTHINLIVPQVVSYPLPLDSPPVLQEFRERNLRQIANESPVDTTVLVYLCRDRLATLKAVLKRRSIVVIGGHRRWWPTIERRLARQMRGLGHEVIFAEIN